MMPLVRKQNGKVAWLYIAASFVGLLLWVPFSFKILKQYNSENVL
jgi:hypothetical protein